VESIQIIAAQQAEYNLGFRDHPVLVSTSKKFIYLKTIKTAGTSVEVYFERYCVDPSIKHEEVHYRDEIESEWGVIGYRGPNIGCARWYNHMPAQTVRSLLGNEIWHGYHKFCVERNPYDKVVSQFWFTRDESQRRRLAEADFGVVRREFGDWTACVALPKGQEVYKIDGQVAVNQIVRYENLYSDLRTVCSIIGVPWEPERLPRLKSEYRVRTEPFRAYYDSQSLALVGNAFAWELDYFGYGKLLL
jgi:hypothetical protein